MRDAESTGPTAGLRAILLTARASATATLQGRTAAVTAQGARILLPRDLDGASAAMVRRGPRELSARLRRRLGTGARLGLFAGKSAVWCGEVRLIGVELGEADGATFVAVFELANPLPLADRHLLGIVVGEGAGEQAPGAGRQAERVPVALPVEVVTPDGAVAGTVKDLSATGLCMHLAASDLGFLAPSDMSELARGLGEKFGSRFTVHLNHTMLGNLLAQTVQLTRVCTAEGSDGVVELGGRFLEPLHEEAAAVLGVSLPAPHPPGALAEGQGPDPARGPEPERAASSEVLGLCTPRKLVAEVRCSAARAPAPTVCETDIVGMGGVVLRLERTCVGASRPGEEGNVLHLTSRFTEVFGAEVTLTLRDASIHLWSGPARVVAMQLPVEEPRKMLVTLAYRRRLDPAESTRLGLARLAG